MDENLAILVIIDMQNDYIDGVLGTEEAQEIVTDVADLISQCKKQRIPVIYTQDTYDALSYEQADESDQFPPHCIRGTWGWHINKALDTFKCTILEQSTFGCVKLVDEILKYRNHHSNLIYQFPVTIQIVGVRTDICVITNALILRTWFPNATILINPKFCAGTTPENQEKALDIMKNCGIAITEDETLIPDDTGDDSDEPLEPDDDNDEPDDEELDDESFEPDDYEDPDDYPE